MIRTMRCATLLGLLLLAGCASAPQNGSSAARSSNVLTREEIVETGLVNMRDVLQRLRPQYLKGRGVSSTQNYDASCKCYRVDEPDVYVDNQRLGGLDMLNSINSRLVESVQFITGPNTGLQFGASHPAGIIHVITKT
jgi:hypothetical protein